MAASSEQKCCMCAAPSIRWPGAPICQSCLDVQAAARIAAKDQPAKIVTIGGGDSAEILARHGAMVALAEARAAEISRGRPPGTALH
jgi:hypothetical protein